MHSPKAVCLILLCCILIYPTISLSEPDNYCHDGKSWKEWASFIFDNPNDIELQTRHALRIGLCIKVDLGQITVEQANNIFDLPGKL